MNRRSFTKTLGLAATAAALAKSAQSQQAAPPTSSASAGAADVSGQGSERFSIGMIIFEGMTNSELRLAPTCLHAFEQLKCMCWASRQIP